MLTERNERAASLFFRPMSKVFPDAPICRKSFQNRSLNLMSLEDLIVRASGRSGEKQFSDQSDLIKSAIIS